MRWDDRFFISSRYNFIWSLHDQTVLVGIDVFSFTSVAAGIFIFLFVVFWRIDVEAIWNIVFLRSIIEP